MGLGVDPSSKYISIVEYLKYYELIDKPIISAYLDS
jgi:hypothetical protein